jgi:integrase
VDAHARIRATEDESGRPPHPAVRRAREGVRGVEVARSRYSTDTDPVFAARNGRPLAHRNATGRGFDKAAANAGIERVTFHLIRHASASRMISRGINSTVLAALMGHESSTITEHRYIHLFDRQRTDEQVRQAMSFSGAL